MRRSSSPRRSIPQLESFPADVLRLIEDALFTGTATERLKGLRGLYSVCQSNKRLNNLLCGNETFWEQLTSRQYPDYSWNLEKLGLPRSKSTYRMLLEWEATPRKKTRFLLDAVRRGDERAVWVANSEGEYDRLLGFLSGPPEERNLQGLVNEAVVRERPDIIVLALEEEPMDEYLSFNYASEPRRQRAFLDGLIANATPENEDATAIIARALLSVPGLWTKEAIKYAEVAARRAHYRRLGEIFGKAQLRRSK